MNGKCKKCGRVLVKRELFGEPPEIYCLNCGWRDPSSYQVITVDTPISFNQTRSRHLTLEGASPSRIKRSKALTRLAETQYTRKTYERGNGMTADALLRETPGGFVTWKPQTGGLPVRGTLAMTRVKGEAVEVTFEDGKVIKGFAHEFSPDKHPIKGVYTAKKKKSFDSVLCKVRAILKDFPKTREDDRLLAVIYYREFHNIHTLLDYASSKSAPPFETISRARRKIKATDFVA